MAVNSNVKDFTIVVTENQINGRGQQGNNWESEPYKNLMFSVFVSFKGLGVIDKKYLNFAVSLAVFDVLKEENTPAVSIKWPNDLLSGNNKICGVLIENSLRGAEISATVIGIGLNVNQTSFPSYLTKTSSLKLLNNRNYSLEELLERIVLKLKARIKALNAKDFIGLEEDYLKALYKKNIPTMFKDSEDVLFIGIIRGVSNEGKLQIEIENETIKEFGLKEVSLA